NSPSIDYTGGTNCAGLGCQGGATMIMLRKPAVKGGNPLDPNNPWFDVDAFARPVPNSGDLGNAPRTVLQKPPISSVNASVFKNFVLGKRRLQFRLEGYNVLNHTQITD